MRVVIIADSHGYGIAKAMVRQDETLEVRTVSVGSVMKNVWSEYLAMREQLQDFRPEQVYLHVGHNDIVRHHRHNPSPKHPDVVIALIMGYELQLRSDFPGSQVWVSNLMPRSVSPSMDLDQKRGYNQMVYAIGNTMRAIFPARGIRYRLNSDLWFRPSEGREHAVLLRPDGLHLSAVGCDKVAAGWLKPTSTELFGFASRRQP
jgi:lysophospholipase L1-like esterase